MNVTKKYIKEPREIENLNYLLSIVPKLIPSIKKITNRYYILEKCESIKSKDILPSNFHNLYLNLIVPLHQFKNKNFTPGIYKYYTPCGLGYEIKNQYYVPYIMDNLKKLIHSVSIQLPDLLIDVTFSKLFSLLKTTSKQFKKWEPAMGFSLLHGDLHIGNIVKKKNNYLLIDFEYLRYGASEFEVANLVISSIIHHSKIDFNNEELKNLYEEYAQKISKLPFLNYISYKFFFIFSLNLFFLSSYVRKKEDDLEIVRKITKLTL